MRKLKGKITLLLPVGTIFVVRSSNTRNGIIPQQWCNNITLSRTDPNRTKTTCLVASLVVWIESDDRNHVAGVGRASFVVAHTPTAIPTTRTAEQNHDICAVSSRASRVD